MKELFDVYPLVENIEEGEHCYTFETYGRDFEKVKNTNVKNVWTLIDGDDDKVYAIAGLHYVNRLSYAISTTEWKDENETYLW
jgi:hypothetical protein